ncbi:putative B3 domain-containing protein At5g66980 isoform X1 [Primulina eburnea]|uniref:putative B3 domain-containing protein At5g66980 isoform X1 n=1 Tax=Primulina eburnea TaxID=1245227 RepID=UPI003C6C9398
MGKNPKPVPSFFKVLINEDFSRQLRLPPAFVKKWGEILPQFLAQLRTSSGKMWEVKLEKQEYQNYYFSGGWAKFCEDLGLAIGEFVVFRYCGSAIFDVSVYGISGCEREFTSVNYPVEDSDPEEAVNCAPVAKDLDVKVKIENEDGTDPQDESDDDEIQRYSKKLDQQHSTRLDISKAFVLSAGIAGDRTIHLQDSKSRLWPVQITSSSRQGGGYRFALTAGWNDFLVGNKVAIGSTVLLECEVPGGSLVKAKVLNNGTKGGKLFQPRGRKGTPSKLCMPYDLTALPCKEECIFF